MVPGDEVYAGGGGGDGEHVLEDVPHVLGHRDPSLLLRQRVWHVAEIHFELDFWPTGNVQWEWFGRMLSNGRK